MSMDLFYFSFSPHSRVVLMTVKALGLTNINLIPVDTFKGEHLKPDFVAINPQHCVPLLVDGDLKICESRAICTYLVSQYGSTDQLYPKDTKKRAQVDRLLYFDACALFPRYSNYAYGVVSGDEKSLDPKKLERLEDAFGMLNTFLEGNRFVAGDSVTVADHVILTSCVSMMAAGIDFSNFPNITAWVDRCKKEMDYFQEAQNGIEEYGKYIKEKIGL